MTARRTHVHPCMYEPCMDACMHGVFVRRRSSSVQGTDQTRIELAGSSQLGQWERASETEESTEG